MYVNGILFLITISRNIQFGSAQAPPDETYKSIYISLHNRIKIYMYYGFAVIHIPGDGQFETMDTSKIGQGITLNIVTNNEHVPEVECYIRTIKDMYNSLPFKKFPNRLLIEIVYANVFWLNAFPSNNGISNSAVHAKLCLAWIHSKLECGSYVQTHENHSRKMEP